MKLVKTAVERAEPRERPYILWDSEIPGFGVRIMPSGTRTYLYRYRSPTGRDRKHKIGRHGVLTCEEARTEARDLARRVALGGDPAKERRAPRESPTVRELGQHHIEWCERRVALGEMKAKTLENYRLMWTNHIYPVIGDDKVADVDERTVLKPYRRIVDKTPAAAARVLTVIKVAMRIAVKEGWRATDPTADMAWPKTRRRERAPSPAETARIGKALTVYAQTGHHAWRVAQLLRLLALTGRRLRELMHARKDQVSLEDRRLWLPDSKGGEMLFRVPEAAVPILEDLLADQPGSPWLFPGQKPGRPIQSPYGAIKTLRRMTGIEDLTPHLMRHLLASAARHSRYQLDMIGKLLGHKDEGSTEIYAHWYDDDVHEATDKVAAVVSDWLAGEKKAS